MKRLLAIHLLFIAVRVPCAHRWRDRKLAGAGAGQSLQARCADELHDLGLVGGEKQRSFNPELHHSARDYRTIYQQDRLLRRA